MLLTLSRVSSEDRQLWDYKRRWWWRVKRDKRWFILCVIYCYTCCSVNRWGITWVNERWRSGPFKWKLFMHDDQKGPLSICASDTIKVPLWLNTAASPGFSHWVIKLEKTTRMYKNAENKLKSLSLECAHLPRLGTTSTLYGERHSTFKLTARADVASTRKKVGHFTCNWACMNVTEGVRGWGKDSTYCTLEKKIDTRQSKNFSKSLHVWYQCCVFLCV